MLSELNVLCVPDCSTSVIRFWDSIKDCTEGLSSETPTKGYETMLVANLFFSSCKLSYYPLESLLVNPTYWKHSQVLPVRASKIDCAIFHCKFNASF